MKGTIEIRFFMFLMELCRERNWPIPMQMELEEEISGITLLERLDISPDRVEVLLVNGKAAWPEEARIQPGDRVALLPPGTPGPYRVLLGFKKLK